jgi:hypothetical protein
MSQSILWLFDDPISDLLLAGILIFAALHHRQMRLMQQRTNELALQVSDLKILISTIPFAPDSPEMTQRAPSKRFEGQPLPH